MTANQFDLHMHSYYSDDGEYMPSGLVARCKERGITENDMTMLAADYYRKDQWTGEMFAEALLSKTKPSIRVGDTGCNINLLEAIDKLQGTA